MSDIFGFEPVNDGWEGELPEGWGVVGGAINGGYLLAVVTALAQTSVRQPDPVTVTGHFTGPGRAGPARVVTTVHKSGGGHSTVGATLVQEGRTVVAALATFGDLSVVPADDPTPAPSGSPHDAVAVTKARAPGTPDIVERLQLRIDADLAEFFTGAPAGRAEMAGWIHPSPETPPGVFGLLVMADVFPPPIFNLGHLGWTPTVELTVHCRRRPPRGWVRGEFRTRFMTGPYLEEDGELRDADGRLLAVSRQLALMPRRS